MMIIIIVVVVFHSSLNVSSFYNLLKSTLKKNLDTKYIYYLYNIYIQMKFSQVIHLIVPKNAS